MDPQENHLIAQLRTDRRFQKMSDTALINIGITTGNNKYFSVTQKTVEEYQLTNVVRPLIGRSSHAASVYFKKEDWSQNAQDGKAAYLIDFPDVPYPSYPRKHRSYIKKGEKIKSIPDINAGFGNAGTEYRLSGCRTPFFYAEITCIRSSC